MISRNLTLSKEVLNTIIRPAVNGIGLGGRAAEELLLGTAIQESALIYRTQFGNGPALGLFQMEPRTFWDLWDNFVEPRKDLCKSIKDVSGVTSKISEYLLRDNDLFAASMCRVHYRRIKNPLPVAGDVQGQAAYWKRFYNTNFGRGNVLEYISKWHQYTNESIWSDK
jgi:hypothetical protein